ncbi:CLUMA_CG018518, isoform A [Clunio marinus]|uniref:CLUMA_CG018518, isoform A n=1 Tax=Clunio marinus TaxID=568069 RepID=A0A1J1IZ76_9DIPT|nr:CLUMA_CG018518, isoform A [Clunio marinus]
MNINLKNKLLNDITVKGLIEVFPQSPHILYDALDGRKDSECLLGGNGKVIKISYHDHRLLEDEKGRKIFNIYLLTMNEITRAIYIKHVSMKSTSNQPLTAIKIMRFTLNSLSTIFLKSGWFSMLCHLNFQLYYDESLSDLVRRLHFTSKCFIKVERKVWRKILLVEPRQMIHVTFIDVYVAFGLRIVKNELLMLNKK